MVRMGSMDRTRERYSEIPPNMKALCLVRGSPPGFAFPGGLHFVERSRAGVNNAGCQKRSRLPPVGVAKKPRHFPALFRRGCSFHFKVTSCEPCATQQLWRLRSGAHAYQSIQYSEFPHPEHRKGNELLNPRFHSQINCSCC